MLYGETRKKLNIFDEPTSGGGLAGLRLAPGSLPSESESRTMTSSPARMRFALFVLCEVLPPPWG